MLNALSPEAEAWLSEAVASGRFGTTAEAITYCVEGMSLRERVLSAIEDPRRLSADDLRSALDAHFASREISAAE